MLIGQRMTKSPDADNKRRCICAIFAAILWLPLICTAHDVVIERNVNLRVGPSTQTDVIKLLKAGDQARLLNPEKKNNYYRVLHNAGVGWVWSNNVKVFPEYLRKQWKHWSDADGDCQHTRQEVLIAESEIAVTFTNSDKCKVASGRWTDPRKSSARSSP